MIYAAMKAIQAFTGWVFVRSRVRSLDILQKRRARLIRLHDRDSDREYYGWLLSGVLWVLMLFAVALVLEGLTILPPAWTPQRQLVAQSLIKAGHYGLGAAACIIAIGRLGDYHQLQRYDRSIKVLDHTIAKLEAKQSLQPAPSGR